MTTLKTFAILFIFIYAAVICGQDQPLLGGQRDPHTKKPITLNGSAAFDPWTNVPSCSLTPFDLADLEALLIKIRANPDGACVLSQATLKKEDPLLEFFNSITSLNAKLFATKFMLDEQKEAELTDAGTTFKEFVADLWRKAQLSNPVNPFKNQSSMADSPLCVLYRTIKSLIKAAQDISKQNEWFRPHADCEMFSLKRAMLAALNCKTPCFEKHIPECSELSALYPLTSENQMSFFCYCIQKLCDHLTDKINDEIKTCTAEGSIPLLKKFTDLDLSTSSLHKAIASLPSVQNFVKIFLSDNRTRNVSSAAYNVLLYIVSQESLQTKILMKCSMLAHKNETRLSNLIQKIRLSRHTYSTDIAACEEDLKKIYPQTWKIIPLEILGYDPLTSKQPQNARKKVKTS